MTQMPTITVIADSPLAPERVLAAGYDFTERRPEIFPAVSTEHLELHKLGQSSADVTEGTPAGIGTNWERCRYEWSTPGSVKATVTDSNVYQPGSSWELRAVPTTNERIPSDPMRLSPPPGAGDHKSARHRTAVRRRGCGLPTAPACPAGRRSAPFGPSTAAAGAGCPNTFGRNVVAPKG